MTAPDTSIIAREFVEALNRHGHAFQHAVLKRAEELRRNYDIDWVFEAAEFPVSIGDAVTHIDVVLSVPEDGVYLVGECKRVDPAMARWCFARAPYTKRNPRRSEVVLEELTPHDTAKLKSAPRCVPWSTPPYQIAAELRTGVQGDGTSSGRDNIERAVAQVLRGTNGLVNHFFAKEWASLAGRRLRFIPAIFTTAEIWTTETDIRVAELQSGRMPADALEVAEAGWVWFNYNMSPHIRHQVGAAELPGSLSEALVAESTRSVAIVSVKGLDQFLATGLF